MSTLAEIEAAAESLSAQEKEKLFLFLAARLRAPGARPPEPRKFTKEQMAAWIAEDEEDRRRFDAEAHRAWLKRTWGERTFTEEEVCEMRGAQERGGE